MTEYTIATIIFILCCVISGAAMLITLAVAISAAIHGNHFARMVLGLLALYSFVFGFYWSGEVLFG